jgi:hypothetical protein
MPAQNNPQDPEALRNALTREVTTDASVIAGQVFRGPQGDVSRVSNEQLDNRYRQAFVNNDRQFLMQEAVRDPEQFLASMERLGVNMPPGEEIQPDPPLPKAAQSNVKIPKPPAAAVQQAYDTPADVPQVPQLLTPQMPTLPPPAVLPGPPLLSPGGGGPNLPPPIPPPAQPPY